VLFTTELFFSLWPEAGLELGGPPPTLTGTIPL
jgi:hypothetical protein